jgi:hypothetical protein
MGNWASAVLPATGQGIAIDVVPGATGTVETQVVKLDSGSPTNSNPVSEGFGLPTSNDGITDLDLGHYLEPLQNVDASGRILVGVPAAVIASGTLTAVTTVATVTVANNLLAIAGIGIEQFINPAESAYYAGVSAGLVLT